MSTKPLPPLHPAEFFLASQQPLQINPTRASRFVPTPTVSHRFGLLRIVPLGVNEGHLKTRFIGRAAAAEDGMHGTAASIKFTEPSPSAV